ncbi:hypothetical protein ACOSQ2_013118 [Xanthoceras sorbifolium]
MEKAKDSKPMASHEVGYNVRNERRELLSTLPIEKNFDSIISSQRHFQAQESDIILITYPKFGTTWLKALTYAIIHRSRCAFEHSPLLTTINPHLLVPFLEITFYLEKDSLPSFEHLDTPRILGTHIPYASLPRSIIDSNCRIVYMCRNPLDNSSLNGISCQELLMTEKWSRFPLEEAFEREHVLGYLKASSDNFDKILLLKYEDVNEDTFFYVKKLAEFLRCPFSNLEENQGVIEEIMKLCSFDMKDLKVNKTSIVISNHGPKNNWPNYSPLSMSEHLKDLMEVKLSGTGLAFRIF